MSIARAAAVVATIGTLAVRAAQAQTIAPSTAVPASPMASLLQSLVGLVVVVALIYGAAWLLKRVGPRSRSGGIVQVLGGASVGPREKVVVIRFGGETLLLGVAPGQVSLLQSVVDPGDLPADAADARDTAAPSRFVDRLRAVRGRA